MLKSYYERFIDLLKLKGERFGNYSDEDAKVFTDLVENIFFRHEERLRNTAEYYAKIKAEKSGEEVKQNKLAKKLETIHKTVEKEKSIFKNSLIYIFNDEDKFGSTWIEDRWVASEKDFAYEIVRLNPNLIYFFDEKVRKDKRILDYISKEAILEKSTTYPNMAFNRGLVEDKIVKFSAEQKEIYNKRLAVVLKEEKEREKFLFSSKSGDGLYFKDERKNKPF